MRSKGSGTKLANGDWRTVAVLTDPRTGEKKRKEFRAKTQREAQKKRDDWLAENGHSAPEEATVADLYRECVRGPWAGHRPKTIELYGFCQRRIEAHFGSKLVGKITPPDVSRFLAKLAAEDPKLSGRTIQIHRNVLGTMLGHARELGWAKENAAHGVRLPRPATPRDFPPIDEGQFARIVEHGGDWAALWRLLGETGLRPFREALPLTEDCLVWRFDHWWVRVGESKTEAGAGRLVPLSDEAARMVRAALPFYRYNVHRQWAKTLKRAGIPHTRLYELRKLAITRWAYHGMEPAVLKALAGHRDFTLTQEVYVRLSKRQLATSALPAGVSSGVSISDILGSEMDDDLGSR